MTALPSTDRAVSTAEMTIPPAVRTLPRVLFFCGHQSRYGLAHLLPILECFSVVGVVLATDERWAIFRESLLGEPAHCPGTTARVKRSLKAIIPAPLLKLRARLLQRELDARTILRDFRSIPRWDVSDANDRSFFGRVRSAEPDLILSAAYPQIFSVEFLSIPPLGAVNFHPSLLPAYRGAHPHFWAIANGEEFSGVTSHFMTPQIDAGDIVHQIKFSINRYSYTQLYERMVEETPRLVRSTCKFFLEGDNAGTPQSNRVASTFRNDREIHRRISWSLLTAVEVQNLARTERGFCFFRGMKVTCLDVTITKTNRNLTNGVQVEGGTIVDLSTDSVAVKAMDDVVNISTIRVGRKTFSAARWISKYRPLVGQQLR